MTDYNGLPVTYDVIGNPLSYDGWTYEWKAGRKLMGMKKQAYDPNQLPTWDQTYPKGGNWEDAGTLLQLKVEYATGAISAKVYKNGVDVTNTFPESNFSWRRQSADQIADIRWNRNEARLKGKKVLTIGAPDIEIGAVIVYQFQDEALGVKLELPVMLKGVPNGYAKQIQYSYDAAGLRTQKVVDGVATNYYLHGKLLTHLTQGNHSMHFYYDKDSKPQALKFMGQYYAYQKNLQGDIIGIIDKTGALVVKYRYDAWGRPTGTETQVSSATDAATLSVMARLNPFRYRGYIFDEETGLYYLRSRYYASVWIRFVNEDITISTGGVLRQNIYAYCKNNPVIYADMTGIDYFIIYDPNIFINISFTGNDCVKGIVDDLQRETGEKCRILPVSSGSELSDMWNDQVGFNDIGEEVEINSVIILTHANSTLMAFNDSSGKSNGKPFVLKDVKNLKQKSMDELILLGCNQAAANPKGVMATEFFNRQPNISYVIGADGKTNHLVSDGKYTIGSSATDPNAKGFMLYQRDKTSPTLFAESGRYSIYSFMLKAWRAAW